MSAAMDGAGGVVVEPTEMPARGGESSGDGTSGDEQGVQGADGSSKESSDLPAEPSSTDEPTRKKSPRPYTRRVRPERTGKAPSSTDRDRADSGLVDHSSGKPVRATTYRETAKERKRRDPLRKELADLVDREKRLTEEIERIRDAIGIATMRLEPLPGETTRPCFGNFDPADYDCRSICPLRPECEIATEKGRVGKAREGATA